MEATTRDVSFMQAGNEMLGVVLLRFPWPLRVWSVILMGVNAAALAFITTIYGQIALAAVLVAVNGMALIYQRLGFVRILGVCHAVWIPMVIWFGLNLPDPVATPALYTWVVSVLVINTICLAIDTTDAVRFLTGDRAPHYTW